MRHISIRDLEGTDVHWGGWGKAHLSDDADGHDVVALLSALQGDESLPQDSLDLAVIVSHGPVTRKRNTHSPRGLHSPVRP